MRVLPLLAITAGVGLSATAADQPWTVATRNIPPFAIKNADGTWTGLSVELWDHIARETGIAYTWTEVDTPDELIEAVVNGDVHASIAAISVTADRSKRVDFSYPYYNSGLALAVPKRGSGWAGIVRSVFSLAFLSAVGGLSAVLMLAAVGVWFFERHKNPDQFGGTPTRALGSAFWWSAVTMTTVGYGDKAPQTFGGRLVGLVWMFASVIIISGFTATIASSLTAARVSRDVQGPSDLPRHVTSTVEGSAAEAYLSREGLSAITFDSIDAALDAVDRGDADACVYDEPLLRYRVQDRPKLTVLPVIFESQDYAIALPLDSAQRKALNIAILEAEQSGWWSEKCAEYLGR